MVESMFVSGLEPSRQREGLSTIQKLLTNIRGAPEQEKFRHVKLDNPAIQKRLFPQCLDLLRCAGFQDCGAELIYRGDPGATLFQEVLVIVESLVLSLPEEPKAAPASSSSSAAKPAPAPSKDAKRSPLERKADAEKAARTKAQASSQDTLAALRAQRAAQYQNETDQALARHLSSSAADRPFDAVSSLNQQRDAHSVVTCTTCSTALRYNSNTRAQAVLCPCGALMQPISMRGQPFVARGPSDLPVEPGEPLGVADEQSSGRPARGPFITVRGPNGEPARLPLHSVLQMVRQHENRQQSGAQDEVIQALPTKAFDAVAAQGASADCTNCQICMEDFEEGDELRTLPCFHLFHARCVDQWLKVNSICPTCRHKIG